MGKNLSNRGTRWPFRIQVKHRGHWRDVDGKMTADEATSVAIRHMHMRQGSWRVREGRKTLWEGSLVVEGGSVCITWNGAESSKRWSQEVCGVSGEPKESE